MTEDEYNITLTRGFWHAENVKNEHYYLESSPEVDQVYTIEIEQKFNTGLNEKTWIYYEGVNKYFNGIDSINDIECVRLCFGELLKVLEKKEKITVIEFKVIKTLTLFDMMKSIRPITFPEHWHNYIRRGVGGATLYVTKYDKFFTIDYDFQGDIQQEYIGIEYENEIYICMIKENYFANSNMLYCGKYIIPEYLRELLPLASQ
ncbi:unnamed protein product [Adineta steineri]|uniref:Uncharacterized protein n=1 Tax=Adineta steineri TaxID=433720 RepID=A0A813U839_9BILA|nr:unnamed protein product [Adineta steineri]CAF1076000.1 unnamed protein product [Adineta steineri]